MEDKKIVVFDDLSPKHWMLNDDNKIVPKIIRSVSLVEGVLSITSDGYLGMQDLLVVDPNARKFNATNFILAADGSYGTRGGLYSLRFSKSEPNPNVKSASFTWHIPSRYVIRIVGWRMYTLNPGGLSYPETSYDFSFVQGSGATPSKLTIDIKDWANFPQTTVGGGDIRLQMNITIPSGASNFTVNDHTALVKSAASSIIKEVIQEKTGAWEVKGKIDTSSADADQAVIDRDLAYLEKNGFTVNDP